MEQENTKAWNLQFSYVDYERRQKNLQKSKIGKYYLFQQLGGSGQFGKVYRGMDGTSKKEVAIKILDKRQVENEKSLNKKKLRKRLIQNQSQIMKKIDSQNVLKCYDCLQNRDLKIMIIEYCNNGSLYDLLQDRGRLPEDEAVILFRQVVKGFTDFHKQKIIHRDLKLQNILIHNGQCKIADFGFSKILLINNENETMKNTILGSLITMAPQVIRKERYGLKADIWSLGVIFFQLIFGLNPFKYDGVNINKCFDDGLRIINSQQEYEGVKPSPQAKKFIRQVLVIDQQKRLGWREILSHELFKVEKQTLPTRFYRRVDLKKNDSELQEIEKQLISVSFANNSQMVNQQFVNQIPLDNTSNQNPEPQQVKLETKTEITSQPQQKPIHQSLKDQKREGPSNITSAIFQIQKQQKEEIKNPQSQSKSQQIQIKPQNQLQPQKINEQKLQKKSTFTKAPNFKSFNPLNSKASFKETDKTVNNPTNQHQKPNKLQPEPQKKSPIIQKKYVPNYKVDLNPQVIEIKRQSTFEKPIFEKLNFEKPKEKHITVPIRDNIQKQMKLKLMDKFSISEQESMTAQKEIDRDEEEIYKWAQRIHSECLRAEFIYDNIVKVIEKHNLLEMNERETIELMYLICTRCRNNISPIYNEYNKRKNTKQGKIILDLRNFVEPLHRIITGKWNTYCNELTKKQNEKFVIFKDFFSKRISQSFKRKDRFLTGIENMQEFKPSNAPQKSNIKVEGKTIKEEILQDYTKQEQIQFTNQCMLEAIKKLRYMEKDKKIKMTMKNFKDICLLKSEGLKPEIFKQELRRISQKQ